MRTKDDVWPTFPLGLVILVSFSRRKHRVKRTFQNVEKSALPFSFCVVVWFACKGECLLHVTLLLHLLTCALAVWHYLEIKPHLGTLIGTRDKKAHTTLRPTGNSELGYSPLPQYNIPPHHHFITNR